jgi:hypothetical protein
MAEVNMATFAVFSLVPLVIFVAAMVMLCPDPRLKLMIMLLLVVGLLGYVVAADRAAEPVAVEPVAAPAPQIEEFEEVVPAE